MVYKAVIFDLDGTLLNTVLDIAVAMNTVLKRARLPEHTPDTYKYFMGHGLRRLVAEALPEQSLGELDKYLAEMMTEYTKCWNNSTNLYPDIAKLLDMLVAKDIKLAILSNKADEFMPEIVATMFKHWQFAAAFGARDGVLPKPDPVAALEIADMLAIKPEEFLFIGDSEIDILTAVNAGMVPIGVSWGFRPESMLKASGAKFVIHHPLELFNLPL